VNDKVPCHVRRRAAAQLGRYTLTMRISLPSLLVLLGTACSIHPSRHPLDSEASRVLQTSADVQPAAFELRLSSDELSDGFVLAQRHPLSGPGRPIYVSTRPFASARDLVGVSQDDAMCKDVGEPEWRGLTFYFNEPAWHTIERVSSANLNGLLSVLSYGRVVETARILGTFSKSIEICITPTTTAEMDAFIAQMIGRAKAYNPSLERP
jgi:hypothetical protein